MEPVRIGVPNQVIENVGDVLDWPVMGRKGIEKEIVPKTLQDKERALDERIVARQVQVVPDQLSLERREMHREPKQRENDAARPGALEQRGCFPEQRAISSAGCDRR